MTTLKERFEETFTSNNKAEIVCKHGAVATPAEVLSFFETYFHRELLALADFVEQAHKNGTLFTSVELIRSKADELK
jgi:hypothetical protein